MSFVDAPPLFAVNFARNCASGSGAGGQRCPVVLLSLRTVLDT